ncbi:MAG: protein kinase [Gemmatimonadota bacterium]|nr:MAG: protein kinase [Gemmatimonadota bacterium]
MATPRTSLDCGTTFANRYEVMEQLGSGGMGEVYRVLDTEIDEEVALKLLRPEITLDPQLVERFRNELKLARRISHPNVCRVYDIGEHEGLYYITMEFVPGEDLLSVLRRSGPLDPAQLISVARQVCEGLAEAHRLDVIHRDLKPQNVLVDEHGRAHVMDFGIARHLGSAGMTETGLVIGTPEYMSPEQIEGMGVDARSDIYSIGVILFELATGQPPFQAPTPLAIAVKHQTTPAPDPRALNTRIPVEISQLILKCLGKDKQQRYQSTTELLADLDRVARSTAVAAGEAAAPPDRIATSPPEAEVPLFVAREEELAILQGFLERAMEGHGRVAFVVGESGSGKTALNNAFARMAELAHPDLVVVSGKCDAHTGTGDPYMPFREIMALLAGDVDALQAAGALSAERARRLRDVVPYTARSVLDLGSDLIGTLVSGTGLFARASATTPPEAGWIENLRTLVESKREVPADSTLQQSSLLEQATRVLQTVAQARPLLLIVDDVQWADSGSINLMFHLGRRIAGSRILFVGAYRPSEVALGRDGQRHPLEPVANELRRDFGDLLIELDRPDDRSFVDALIDGRPNRIGEAFRETLFRHTRGHPLFTIELLRSMQEQGWLVEDESGELVEVSDIDWETVPARVDAVVEERVGRLSNQLRDIVRLASVEGEDFTAEVAARVQNLDPRELVRLLSSELEKRHHLVRAKGISRVNGTRLSHYAFQHILFQKHLYGELDDVERAFLHDAVGTALEELYGDQTDDIAVQLARHFREAGVVEKAVDYLQRAGQQAVRLSANEEAIAHFSNALKLIDALPPGPERNEKELALQLGRAVPLQWARGFAAPELAQASVRARELCEEVRDPGQMFAALAQLTLFYATRPDYHLALELVEQMGQLAAGSDDPSLTTFIHFLQTWPLLNIACFTKAVECAERAMAAHDPARDSVTAYTFGFELGVLNLAFESWSLWFLGFPERARRTLDRGLALARELGHPHTVAFILVGACELHWFLREPATVDQYTEELAPLADEKGFIYWQAHAAFYRAERMVREGQVEDGIEQMREAIAGMRATGTETCLTRLYTRMVDACEGAGEFDEAAAAVAAAAEIMQQYDERYMEAEIHRHRGNLLLLRGGEETEAEAEFERAIDTACRQQAKALELRAVMSLARLWQSQGKSAAARERLADIYGRFTEGFETPDLQDAKALLASL